MLSDFVCPRDGHDLDNLPTAALVSASFLVVVAFVRHCLRRTRGLLRLEFVLGSLLQLARSAVLWAWGEWTVELARVWLPTVRERWTWQSSAGVFGLVVTALLLSSPPAAEGARPFGPLAGVRRHVAWRVRLLLGLPHPAAAPAAAPLSAGGASAIARMDLSDLVSPPAARPHRQRADSSYLEEAMRTAIDVRDDEIKRIEGEKREVLQGCKEAKALLMRATAGQLDATEGCLQGINLLRELLGEAPLTLSGRASPRDAALALLGMDVAPAGPLCSVPAGRTASDGVLARRAGSAASADSGESDRVPGSPFRPTWAR